MAAISDLVGFSAIAGRAINQAVVVATTITTEVGRLMGWLYSIEAAGLFRTEANEQIPSYLTAARIEIQVR
jgi:hypothetical protein